MKFDSVIFVLPNLHIGGAERNVLNLVSNWHKFSNLKIYLILFERVENEYEFPKGVDIIILNSRSSFAIYIDLFKKIRELNPLCVFSNLGANHKLAILRLFLWNIKLFSRIGNDVPKYLLDVKKNRGYLRYFFERLLIFISLLLSNKIIVQSDAMKAGLINQYHFSSFVFKSRIIQINNILSSFDDIKLIKKSISPETMNFIVLSSLKKQKNIEFLLNAFKYINQEFENANLSIFGNGPEFNYLQKIIETKKLDKFIYLKGFTKSNTAFAGANFYINSSLYEGVSNGILEAMMIGIPIFTSNTSGSLVLDEASIDGFYSMKIDSPENFAQKVIQIIKNYGFKFHNREIFLEKFSAKLVINDYINLIPIKKKRK